MAKTNRRCCICGQNYHYCPTCGEDAGKPSWYHIFDGENCHDIYEVCTQYRDNVIDKEAAYNLISKLDLSKMDDFAESTKSQIEEIMKSHKEIKTVAKEEKVEPVKEISRNTNNAKNDNKK